MRRCNSNACQQGRAPCPTPCACEVPEPEIDFLAERLRALAAVGAWMALSLTVFAAAGLIAGIFYNA